MNTDFLLSSFAADTTAAPSASLYDRLALGLEVTLLGMATVFAVLILLWILLELSKYIFAIPTKKNKSSEFSAEDIPEVNEITQTPDARDELETAAVISAAIAAASADFGNDKNLSFRVVSFKRRGKKPADY